MDIQLIIVILCIAAAAYYFGPRIYTSIRKGKCGCCDGDCDSAKKARAAAPLPMLKPNALKANASNLSQKNKRPAFQPPLLRFVVSADREPNQPRHKPGLFLPFERACSYSTSPHKLSIAQALPVLLICGFEVSVQCQQQ